MSNGNTEDLRKAARRVFWATKKLDEQRAKLEADRKMDQQVFHLQGIVSAAGLIRALLEEKDIFFRWVGHAVEQVDGPMVHEGLVTPESRDAVLVAGILFRIADHIEEFAGHLEDKSGVEIK
jgi:hypothetical protein